MARGSFFLDITEDNSLKTEEDKRATGINRAIFWILILYLFVSDFSFMIRKSSLLLSSSNFTREFGGSPKKKLWSNSKRVIIPQSNLVI